MKEVANLHFPGCYRRFAPLALTLVTLPISVIVCDVTTNELTRLGEAVTNSLIFLNARKLSQTNF
jgi:hypothetical protein